MQDNLTGTRPLRIAFISNPGIPVPPKHYGGIERFVWILLKALIERGHEITLFASYDSSVPCRLIPFKNLFTLYSRLLRMRKEFDIINSFGRLLYLLPVIPLNSIKVQSCACPINPKKVRIVNKLAKGTLTFVASSNSCAQRLTDIGRWTTIYYAVDTEQYSYNPHPNEGHLLFLGRISRIKGAHTAIDIAKAVNLPLKLAGNIDVPASGLRYFKEVIQPQIDGRQVQYVGPVDDYQKNKLLSEASALLFPIEWEEPFGLVMIEALPCGTPVIAFRRGAVPEILTEGLNGFICDSREEMISAVGKVNQIDRAQCRKTVEMRFSAEKAALEYEELYMQLLNNG